MKRFLLKWIWRLLYGTQLARLLSDDVFTQIMYFCYTGQKLNLENPSDFNQKIQWLKLNYRDPIYVQCADKYSVRKYVQEKIGGQYLNDCIGVYERVEDIDFAKLPNRFVLKATHGSGWNIVCADKSKLDWKDACKRMRKWLKSDFYEIGREWQYHEIKPRIICEAFMSEPDGAPIKDYKFFTFKGRTKYIAVEFDKFDEMCSARKAQHILSFYDTNWNYQKEKRSASATEELPPDSKPSQLNAMFDLAYSLASSFPMCRVDFYVLGGKKIVFGELTFTPGKGCNAFSPKSFNEELGGYIELPINSIKT